MAEGDPERPRFLPPRAPGSAEPPRFEDPSPGPERPGGAVEARAPTAPAPPAPPSAPAARPADPAPHAQPAGRPVFVHASDRPTNGIAVASLVLGISGLVLWFFTLGLAFFLNLPCSVLAWVLGVRAKRRVDRNEAAGQRGLAVAGQVLGIIGVVVGVLAVVAWVLLLVLVDWSGLDDGFGPEQGPFVRAGLR